MKRISAFIKKLQEGKILFYLILILFILPGCLQSEKTVNQTPSKTPTPSLPVPTPTPSLTPLPHLTPTPVPGITSTPWVLPLMVTTDKSHYLPGETVEIKLTLENNGGEVLRIPSFPPEIKITHSITGKTIRTFPSGDEEIDLKPGESISYTLRWDQRDENGMEVSPGSYYIEVGVVKAKDTYFYGFGGVRKKLVIGYPQGALNRTIELNESKTSGGVTVILQKIEFTPSEVRFYLQTDIPVIKVGGSAVPLPPPTPPDALSSYSASLKVDGEERPVKAWAFKPDDKWTIVFIADPIQSDAEMLNFVVRNSETWEFNVSLK